MTTETTTNRSNLKGTIAAGAATAVLLGGFGAFSLWQDATGAGTSGSLASGELAIAEPTSTQWTLTESDGVIAEGSTIDPATFVASPGDVITYAATVPVTVDGSDILADLVVNTDEVVPTGLSSYVDVTLRTTSAVGTVASDGSSIRFDGSLGQESVVVLVDVAFDATGTLAQGETALVDLDSLEFQLNQVTGP